MLRLQSPGEAADEFSSPQLSCAVCLRWHASGVTGQRACCVGYCQRHRIDVWLLYLFKCASACLQLKGG